MIRFVELYSVNMSLNLPKPHCRKAPLPGLFMGLLVILSSLLNGCTTTPPIQEMSDARQSVEAAKQAGATKLAPGAIDNAEQLLTMAEVGMRSGNFEEAQQDAIAAREAARQALAISEVKQVMEAEQPQKTEKKEVTKSTPPTYTTYRVRRGDSLWTIASRPELYGDPLLWPLLFKENHLQISDADLIFPGQLLRLKIAPTNAEIQSARAHALTRGEWHSGTTENTDLRYLNE